MPNSKKSYRFVAWCEKHITGDAKGQPEFFPAVSPSARSRSRIPESRPEMRAAQAEGYFVRHSSSPL